MHDRYGFLLDIIAIFCYFKEGFRFLFCQRSVYGFSRRCFSPFYMFDTFARISLDCLIPDSSVENMRQVCHPGCIFSGDLSEYYCFVPFTVLSPSRKYPVQADTEDMAGIAQSVYPASYKPFLFVFCPCSGLLSQFLAAKSSGRFCS